jgi:hypothetical protein
MERSAPEDDHPLRVQGVGRRLCVGWLSGGFGSGGAVARMERDGEENGGGRTEHGVSLGQGCPGVKSGYLPAP